MYNEVMPPVQIPLSAFSPCGLGRPSFTDPVITRTCDGQSVCKSVVICLKIFQSVEPPFNVWDLFSVWSRKLVISLSENALPLGRGLSIASWGKRTTPYAISPDMP